MSISSVSSVSNAIQANASTSTSHLSLWTQLGGALKSGNLAGAQKAFAALRSNYEAKNAGAKPSGPLASDVESLAQALKSGSLSAAQSAFSTLKQAAEAAGITGDSGSPATSTPTSATTLSVHA